MAATQLAAPADLETLHEVAQQIRVDGIRASTKAGSGHPTSSMSAADLMAVLAGRHLRYDFGRPQLATNDHLIFSKGHASPLLYALYKACGAITDDELMTYRTFGSRLEGHPTPVHPLGGRRHRLPGPGAAHRGRGGARRQVPGQAPLSSVGALRRQRAGRGLLLGGVRQGGPLQPRQPHRHRRRQPAGPARRDRVRLEPRGLSQAGRILRLPRHRRSTATTSSRSTAPTSTLARPPAARA